MKLKLIYFILLGFILQACSSLPDTLDSMNLKNQLTETADYIVLQSAAVTEHPVCFVFYPGGLVDPHAYLKWQDELVSKYPELRIVTVKMPGNLAVLGIQKGMRVKKLYPNTKVWITGGHSLGGPMAATMLEKHPSDFDALILIAAYPADNGLKNWDGAVLSVHASDDGLSTPAKISAHYDDLPSKYIMKTLDDFSSPLTGRTNYYEIVGGNHAQFGSYGAQSGDNAAEISRTEQQDILVTVLTNFISQL